jgi:hypothetical protein
MNDQPNQGSGTNTVLIVILLLIVVAGGVWIASRGGLSAGRTEDNTRDINVDLSLPGGQQGGGGSDSGNGEGQY